MDNDRVRSILIVGGGVGAWLAAAILSRRLSPALCTVRLLDIPIRRPDPPGLVALPSFRRLTALLGVEERELLGATVGTCSLGTEFRDWHRQGDAYFHGFGSVGARLEAVSFHHHWARLRSLGDTAALEDYSVAAVAARAGRFAHPANDPRSLLSLYSYGYHLDAARLAAFLRRYAENRGVLRLAGEIEGEPRRAPDGSIESLPLTGGADVAADLFVDCGAEIDSGVDWVDWTRWLPCDRAVAIRRQSTMPTPACSEVRAAPCGWQWQIPLQHDLDSGYAYSARYCDADAATEALQATHPDAGHAGLRNLSFRPGRPEASWRGNCISLATNALAPLEATALHLTQTAITRLLSLFPVRRVSPPDIAEFNRLTALELDRVRDLMVLHYAATAREDSPFWTDCREMELPDTLQTKLELFRRCGRVALLEEEHFSEDSWLTVMIGQHIYPESYDPLADVSPVADTRAALQHMRSAIRDAVATLPPRADFARLSGVSSSRPAAP